jgi:hypothetical protein
MPDWLTDLLKALGVATPALYASTTFAVFQWLETNASTEAKAAISEWLRSKPTGQLAVGTAILELFDRVYTPRLASWRALLRSASITIIISAILYYELYPPKPVIMPLILSGDAVAIIILLGTIFSNIISDYLSLFVVRHFLSAGRDNPFRATWQAPLIGIGIVFALILLQNGFLALWYGGNIGNWSATYGRFLKESFSVPEWRAFMLAPLVVHLWLPLTFLSVMAYRLLGPGKAGVVRIQWFLAEGHDRPLSAIGLIASAVVLLGSAIFQHLF